jgi:FKBP-type peptidyl-prolyl cis-trans isomerase
MKKINLLIAFGLLFIYTSCKQGGNFVKLASGIEYQIIVENKDKPNIEAGDRVQFHIVEKDHKDSILSSSYKTSMADIPSFPKLDEIKQIKQDALEPFFKFSEGDSVLIRLSTDTLYNRAFKGQKQAVENLKNQMKTVESDKKIPDDQRKMQVESYKYNIKLAEEKLKEIEKVFPKGKYQKLYCKIVKVEKLKNLREKETKDIKDYISKNQLKVNTTATGLNYVITQEGKGDKPQTGDMVKVHYLGKFLDGKVFDTSIKAEAEKNKMVSPGRDYKPIEIPIGQGAVIPGWDEGIQLLNKGSKALFIIPSKLAYGEQGRPGGIPPFSPLVFEVELVDFKKPEKGVELPKMEPKK